MEFANPEEYQSKIKQILITEDQIKEALKKSRRTHQRRL